MEAPIKIPIRFISLFIFFSSGCFAVQTLQQCKDGLFNPSLRDQVCENHAMHFLRNSFPAVGILVKNSHYLYKDKTQVEYADSGQEQLLTGLKIALGTSASKLQNIESFHQSLVDASKDHWDSVSRLLGYGVFRIPKIKPLKLLVSVSFADVIMPGTTFSFDRDSQGILALQTVKLLDQATSAGTERRESPKAAPPVVLQARLADRKLGALLTSMKFGVTEEAYTEELECSFKDGQTRKVVLVCPYQPEQQERREKCSPDRQRFPSSIWSKMAFGSHAYSKLQ